ncbi:Protein rer1a [Globisporangium polare]
MEANTPYALYDNDGTRPMQWAAHIRLTPELLLKLQQTPEQVLLTLNANSADARKSTKKTSLLSVDMGASAAADGESEESGLERYELHSFKEDPRVNYLCTFRQDDAHEEPAPADPDSGTLSHVTDSASNTGFSVYTTGKIYQKLIVQRMLNSTEKGRMKDRHAQSVIESRSRASKLLEDQPPPTGKRKRVSLFSTQFSKPDAKAVDVPLRKIVLPSALSAEDAQKTRERIEKGFEKVVPPSEPGTDAVSNTKQQTSKTSTATTVKTKGMKPTGQASLFSSDSDGSGDQEEGQEEKESKPAEEKPVPVPEVGHEASKTPQKKKAPRATKKVQTTSDAVAPETAATATNPSTAAQIQASASQAAPVAPPQLPKPRRPPVVSDTKRPLPRASRIPDLSFFPKEVGLICKRIATHTTRSVVLDEEDYDTFVHQHEGFRADWETLDKAHSIEMINIEGLHVRMQFAADDQERADLEREHQENAKKKEALLFVREAMASIQKILSGIQVSIARFDRKQSSET